MEAALARAEARAESDEQREHGESFDLYCKTAGCNRRSCTRPMGNSVCCVLCDDTHGARHALECDASDAAWRARLLANKRRDRPEPDGGGGGKCPRRVPPPAAAAAEVKVLSYAGPRLVLCVTGGGLFFLLGLGLGGGSGGDMRRRAPARRARAPHEGADAAGAGAGVGK